MASKRLFKDDLKKCDCSNPCNRIDTGKRGACPCLMQGSFCTPSCTCGKGKIACKNKPGKGGPLDAEFGLDEDTDSNDSSNEEVITVKFIDVDSVVDVPESSLNISLQEAAEEALQLTYSDCFSPAVLTEENNQTGTEAQEEDETILSMEKRVYKAGPLYIMDQVIKFLKHNPQYTSDILPPSDEGPPEPPHSQEEGFSCYCGMCQEMPTAMEQLCCRSRSRGRCILFTAQETMEQSLLNRVTLQIAIQNNNLIFADRDNIQSNDNLRHMAYRQFVVWHYGFLGAGNRVVVPSCFVCETRRRFPSTDGRYTGFIPTRLF